MKKIIVLFSLGCITQSCFPVLTPSGCSEVTTSASEAKSSAYVSEEERKKDSVVIPFYFKQRMLSYIPDKERGKLVSRLRPKKRYTYTEVAKAIHSIGCDPSDYLHVMRSIGCKANRSVAIYGELQRLDHLFSDVNVAQDHEEKQTIGITIDHDIANRLAHIHLPKSLEKGFLKLFPARKMDIADEFVRRINALSHLIDDISRTRQVDIIIAMTKNSDAWKVMYKKLTGEKPKECSTYDIPVDFEYDMPSHISDDEVRKNLYHSLQSGKSYNVKTIASAIYSATDNPYDYWDMVNALGDKKGDCKLAVFKELLRFKQV